MAKIGKKSIMVDTPEDVNIGDAVEAAVAAVENVVKVAVADVEEEVVELSEATKAEMAAGLEALKKFVTGA
jgi:hypothetical protein